MKEQDVFSALKGKEFSTEGNILSTHPIPSPQLWICLQFHRNVATATDLLYRFSQLTIAKDLLTFSLDRRRFNINPQDLKIVINKVFCTEIS